MESLATETRALSAQLCVLLANKGPELQGAVLCDLVARWVAGHVAENDDAEETAKIQAELLDLHVTTVRHLVSIIEKQRA
jgi:hypothetical protein